MESVSSNLHSFLKNIGKNLDFDSKLKAELPEFWLPIVRDNTPIILDLSDIAKPFVEKIRRWTAFQ